MKLTIQGQLVILSILVLVGVTACVQLPNKSETASEDTSDNTRSLIQGEIVRAEVLESELVNQEPLSETQPSPVVEEQAEDEAPQVAVLKAPANVDIRKSLYTDAVEQLCIDIGNKLGSVSVEDCHKQGFYFGGGFSTNERPLVFKEVPPRIESNESVRVLLLGGIHGDEYSSISIIFKWLELFSSDSIEGGFYWRIAPLINPDGLLDGQAKRQNASGVDLNRNFPSTDWNDSAAEYWLDNTGSNPRRYPGDSAASEPEVQWVVSQIDEFKPDVIISVHAPYHLLDFDGPSEAPDQIGELYLHQLGVYPGSLGNFAGLDKSIPVVTLELPSAGILPSKEQIHLMWLDLVSWLDAESQKNLAAN